MWTLPLWQNLLIDSRYSLLSTSHKYAQWVHHGRHAEMYFTREAWRPTWIRTSCYCVSDANGTWMDYYYFVNHQKHEFCPVSCVSCHHSECHIQGSTQQFSNDPIILKIKNCPFSGLWGKQVSYIWNSENVQVSSYRILDRHNFVAEVLRSEAWVLVSDHDIQPFDLTSVSVQCPSATNGLTQRWYGTLH